MACGYDECGYDCAPGCTGCSGSCKGDCDGSCDGCRGCGGCGGCDNSCDGCDGCGGRCSNNCSGTCDSSCQGCRGTCTGSCQGCQGCTGTCTGSCTGTCKNTCTDCTGQCTGKCDNGCTAQNTDQVYNNLGVNITLNKIMYAADWNEIVACMNKELTRRGKSGNNSNTSAGQQATLAQINALHNSLRLMGKTSADLPAGSVTSTTDIKQIITEIKNLYKQNLQP